MLLMMIDIDRYLMFYAQSTAKGYRKAKQNVFLPQINILIHYVIHIPPLEIAEIVVGNEVERAVKAAPR